MNKKILNIVQKFQLPGTLLSVSLLNKGHINDTWKITVSDNNSSLSFILQKINTNVFKEPAKVMDNIHRVLDHLNCKKTFKKALRIIQTKDEKLFFKDELGEYWRVYNFISGAISHDEVPSSNHAFQGAKGFGLFIKALIDFPEPSLFEIIPNFHNTEEYYKAFEIALEKASGKRLEKATDQIQIAKNFSFLKSKILDLLQKGKIPLRVTHNDTKLNNALLDEQTLETVSIIDLDTLMPGSVLYDFGDYVRTAARIGAEDEQDLSKVSFSPEFFDAALKGFMESTTGVLNDTEILNLPLSGAVITYEIGLRFLADYLEGDIFYKTSRPDQNLNRAAVQFKVVKEMLRYLEES